MALLSVGDKRDLATLGAGLVAHGVTLVATQGTYATLVTDGIAALSLAHDLGLPPRLDGRLRTLHPGLHAAIAATEGELGELDALDLAPIDLVVVVPRWFPVTSGRPDATLAMAIEDIDTGGVALLRAAARNHERVAVLAHPDDYSAVLAELDASGGALSAATRRRLAARAFAVTAAHDAAIASFLADRTAAELAAPDALVAHHRLGALVTGPWRPAPLLATAHLADELGLYADPPPPLDLPVDELATVIAARALGGRALTTDVIGDGDRALAVMAELTGPAVIAVVGGQPVWAAVGDRAARAWSGELDLDRLTAATLAVDRPLTAATLATALGGGLAAVIAPAVDDDVLAAWPVDGPALLVADGRWHAEPWAAVLPALTWRSVAGGLLVQEVDALPMSLRMMAAVTSAPLTADDERDLALACVVAKHARSHALVLAKDGATLAIVHGQPDLPRALAVAVACGGELRGAVAASSVDPDDPAVVDTLASLGVRALVCPGDGARLVDVIAAAARHGLALRLTGLTHHRR